jgi:hypothetical protein
MNAGRQPILVLKQDCNCTVDQVTAQLNEAGYSVVRSFDLLSALARYTNSICQMVILLVYGKEGPPSTLIIDGNDISTSVFLDHEPDRSTRSRFITLFSCLCATDRPSDTFLNEATENVSNPPALLHDKCP